MYAGFGTLKQLVEDLRQDGAWWVRVDHLHVPGAPGEYGVRLDRAPCMALGVMVSARVDGEVRYACLPWRVGQGVAMGSQQRIHDAVMSGKDVPDRTEAAYGPIVAWLQEQGFETRPAVAAGSDTFPANLRLMAAAAGCVERRG